MLAALPLLALPVLLYNLLALTLAGGFRGVAAADRLSAKLFSIPMASHADWPVSLGDLLSFYARVTRIGNTSIGVHVDVYAERNPANLHVVKVTEADLTYVAIDAQGQPRPVPR